eukprot:4577639-Pyramimonas_sp.AAC.1
MSFCACRSDAPSARYMAASVPLLNGIRCALGLDTDTSILPPILYGRHMSVPSPGVRCALLPHPTCGQSRTERSGVGVGATSYRTSPSSLNRKPP